MPASQWVGEGWRRSGARFTVCLSHGEVSFSGFRGSKTPNDQPGLRKGGSIPLSSNCSAPALPPGPSQSRLSTLNQARHSLPHFAFAPSHCARDPIAALLTLAFSKAGQCQKYVFETGFQRYEVDADSEKGIIFQSFAYRTGEDQVSRREWQGDNKRNGRLNYAIREGCLALL
jgi:hypothetical protein